MITKEVALAALELHAIDDAGLDEMDRRLLDLIIEKFAGGPVGLNSLGAALGEQVDTIEDVYEPFLIQEGFVVRTPRGREATSRAYAHLGRQPPEPGQMRLV